LVECLRRAVRECPVRQWWEAEERVVVRVLAVRVPEVVGRELERD
jgi:hypothetical protein